MGLFVVGLVVGLVVAWLLVSWSYFEWLKKAGYIDSRGRWIRIPVKWDGKAYDIVARAFMQDEPERSRKMFSEGRSIQEISEELDRPWALVDRWVHGR